MIYQPRPLVKLLLSALMLFATGLASPAGAAAADTGIPWQKLSAGDKQHAESLGRDYMRFLADARIPLTRTRYLRAEAERAGFRAYTGSEAWTPGAKFYWVNRERAMLMWVVGQRPVRDGIRMIGAHLDSPRLDLRIRPLKSGEGLMLMKAEPYGGIKRYQWSNLPLALVGQVARLDGKLVDVSIGLSPDEPVFVLPDLAPHVDKEQRKRLMDEVFRGEELNVLAGSIPDAAGDLKQGFLKLLNERYGIAEEDFVSSELSLVPAQAPRYVGLDGGLIGGYGQDDALCSFIAARSLMRLPATPQRTTLVYLVDHEEVGNTNTTGVRSRFFTAALERFAAREKGAGTPSEAVSMLLARSEGISADVSQAINPNFTSTEDPQTTARLGLGFTLKTMRPGFDATPAYRARLRRLLTERKIPWQTYAYKVDGGGGATIGATLQELDMDVVDVGAPLLAMHGTFEVCSKADLFALERFFSAYMASP